jgi:hypothetical protein
MPQETSYRTNEVSSDSKTEAGQLQFVIQSLLAWVRTTGPVEVVEVSNDGGVAPIGHVAIKPLVGQLDGNGNLIPHGIIYNVPYMRVQGGSNAIILDPQVGDIGLAAFCDRDISTVKATQQAAPPGSRRRHDMSDAVYLYTVLSNSPPSNYVRVYNGGIDVVSPFAVNIKAPKITSDGPWAHTGSITVSEDVIASGVSLVQHEHGGVARGGAMTSPPVAGYPGKSASFSANSPAGAEL